MPITVSRLVTHPLLWRVTGVGSSIVGFSCYALSPSFRDLFGQRTPLKVVIYSVVSSVLSILMLFVKNCRGLVRSFLLKAHVGFLVLTLTSLYSFLEARSEEGKVEKGYGRMMNLTSTGAFALMAMSLSRQLQLEFEVGIFNFFLGCFLVTVMKMNFKLAPVAALLCYLLVNIRYFSDFLLEMRGRGATEDAHGHGGESLVGIGDTDDDLELGRSGELNHSDGGHTLVGIGDTNDDYDTDDDNDLGRSGELKHSDGRQSLVGIGDTNDDDDDDLDLLDLFVSKKM